MKPIHDEQTVLARWICTKEEWLAFDKWRRKRQSRWRYFWHRLLGKRDVKGAEITITRDNVQINNDAEPFSTAHRELRRIDIRDAGYLNVLEISYSDKRGAALNEIRVPVPRGKLREAIALQQLLSSAGNES